MLILISGTPGVGKTTVSGLLADRLNAFLIDINRIVDEKHLYRGIDKERGYKVVDLYGLFHEINGIIDETDNKFIIIEGHLSHLFEKSDIVIVLRANPDVLNERMKIKGWREEKICENIEAEAIDVISYEAYQIHEYKANEIDTSNIKPEEVVDLIIDVIKGNKKFPVGIVDFLEYLK